MRVKVSEDSSSFSVEIADIEGRLRRGLGILSRRDVVVRAALKKWGYPQARVSEAGFPTLLRAIVAQQLSKWAAEAICLRLDKAGAFEATRCARMSEARLFKIGLSRRKVSYARGLAGAFVRGELDAGVLEAMGDEEAINLLCSYSGIGLWTAEIYLMFGHGRMDIFPAGDLALRGGLSILGLGDEGDGGKDSGDRFVSESVARGIAERWRPYRSCVALLLWRVYGAERRGKGLAKLT